jgi:hypothetical protein
MTQDFTAKLSKTPCKVYWLLPYRLCSRKGKSFVWAMKLLGKDLKGEAIIYTPSNDWNWRHIQSDHYSKYACQKASRKILILFFPRYIWQIHDITSEKDVTFFAFMGNSIFSKYLFHQEKQTLAYDWTGSKFLTNYSWMKKHYTWRSWFFTVQRTSPSVWSASIEQVFMWKHWLIDQFYGCIRSCIISITLYTSFSATFTLAYILPSSPPSEKLWHNFHN